MSWGIGGAPPTFKSEQGSRESIVQTIRTLIDVVVSRIQQ